MMKYITFLFTVFSSVFFAKEPDWRSRILYDRPELYKTNGEQTTIHSEEWKKEILERFSQQPLSLDGLISIQKWIKSSFKFNRGYGVTIGSITAEDIYGSRLIRGCHDSALIFASIARLLGYSCIFIDTTSVAWSRNYSKGTSSEINARGHVLLEIYLDEKWILFDPVTGFYLDRYDPLNPYIFIDQYKDEAEGFYVLNKGRDNWDFGIRCLEDLLNLQRATANTYFLD